MGMITKYVCDHCKKEVYYEDVHRWFKLASGLYKDRDPRQEGLFCSPECVRAFLFGDVPPADNSEAMVPLVSPPDSGQTQAALEVEA